MSLRPELLDTPVEMLDWDDIPEILGEVIRIGIRYQWPEITYKQAHTLMAGQDAWKLFMVSGCAELQLFIRHCYSVGIGKE